MKKILCMLLTFLILISSMPVPSFADDAGNTVTANIKLSDAAYVRNIDGSKDKALGGSTLVVDRQGGVSTHGNRRVAFLKFDFADYADDLDSISEITLSLAGMDAKDGADFVVYLLPDDKESWSGKTLTYISANEDMNMVSTECGEVIYTSGNVENSKFNATSDLKTAIIKHLKENIDNTVISFKIDTSKELPYRIYGIGTEFEPYVTIKKTLDIESELQKVYDDLTFDKINVDPEDNVVSNFTFVTSGKYGTAITWESSDPETVNPDTGIVTQPSWGKGDKNVTLTATIANGKHSLVKTFEITVPESGVYPGEYLDSKEIYTTEGMFIRSGGSYENNSYPDELVVDSRHGVGLNRIGFIKFDFTGNEDLLEKSQTITLRLDTKSDCKEADNNNFAVYMLNDNMEDIDSTLTYASARDKGLVDFSANLVYMSDGALQPDATYETVDLKKSIIENLENNPDNKVVWFKIASTRGVGYSISGVKADESIRPALLMKYPKPAAEIDSLYLTIPEKTDSDLTLPVKGRFGSDIEWTSSDENLISSDGKVNFPIADEDFGAEDPSVNLNAKISFGEDVKEKDFIVRVIRKGISDASADTYVTAEGNFSDSKNFEFGGTSENAALIYFDISENLDYIKNSRKTVLKLYGDEDCMGRSVTVSCITDSSLKTDDISSLSYDNAKKLSDFVSKYKVTSVFDSNCKAVFDVTEYVRDITDGKALFSLSADGARVYPYTLENGVDTTPKLISSPTEYTDEYAVQRAADELTFDKLSGENPNSIRKNLTLPTDTVFGGKIEWTSSDEAVNASDGSLNRGAENKDVTLTAKITVGEASITKAFDITVIKSETEGEYAEYLASTLAPVNFLLTSSITLPGDNLPADATVTWKSSEEYEAAVEGLNLTVTRPLSSDLSVTLTATVKYKEAEVSKDYVVTVIRSGDKNLLRNRKVVSGDSSASKSVDENINTSWDVKEKTVVFDMGSDRIISGMTIVPCKGDISNMNIFVSSDNNIWTAVKSSVSCKADILNYITYSPSVYGRYLKIDFNGSVSAVNFLAAYSYADSESDDGFASVTVPERATSDFDIAENISGNPITWKSSSDAITVSGGRAIVRAKTSGINVTLTANVTIDGTDYTKSYVVYVPGTGSSGGGGGSGSGSKKNTGGSVITAPIINNESTNANDKFKDLDSVSWAKKYINYLADKNIVSGKTDGYYYPNDNIKREEIAKILVLAFDIGANPETSVSFSDVPSGSWFESYVTSLVSSGGANGVGGGSFGVGSFITRQDAFKMLASVLKLDQTDTSETSFGDDSDISDYARGAINALYAKGIISGDTSGKINPKANITRAEAAKIICLAIGV
ncbi:MAG: immunoglobulin-like domain-containing protein [Clostridia bacterium]|nr:immunoglobulin-like domain-containing protein [Clostridia bacterium]